MVWSTTEHVPFDDSARWWSCHRWCTLPIELSSKRTRFFSAIWGRYSPVSAALASPSRCFQHVRCRRLTATNSIESDMKRTMHFYVWTCWKPSPTIGVSLCHADLYLSRRERFSTFILEQGYVAPGEECQPQPLYAQDTFVYYVTHDVRNLGPRRNICFHIFSRAINKSLKPPSCH